MKRKALSSLLLCGAVVTMLAGNGICSYGAVDSSGTAPDVYNCQLYAEVTDAGQVVNGIIIDFGHDKMVANVDKDTFTVHAQASTEAFREGTDLESYGDYDMDRKIITAGAEGQNVMIYLDKSEGATLAYTSGLRNYPADLTYTITQNKPITLMDANGTVISDSYFAAYTCDNTVIDPETAKFEAVFIPGGINYQFYNAGPTADTLVIWFHGNGEGDLLGSNNNVAQILANRGAVAWASDEAQSIFGGAYVMAFQAPDTWYYAQSAGLLDMAAAEISQVINQYGINPNKVVVAGCSAGGYMTTRMLIAHPELFSAALITCPAYDVATERGGQTPTDDELLFVKNTGIPIWLVQGATDSSVATDQCSKRLFAILTNGVSVSETRVAQAYPENADFTTYETADNRYKLSIYDTTSDDKLRFAEDYDWDNVMSEVQYSNHWSWIYTLNNNPQAADGTHIMNWAAGVIRQ